MPIAPTPDRSERTALRVLQAGLVGVVLVAATYPDFDLDRYFVPKELVLHGTACLAGLLALGAVRRVSVTWVDGLLLAFLAAGAVSAVLATNPWVATRALAVNASGVVVFWVARGLQQAGLARPLLAAVVFGVVLAVGMALLQAYGVSLPLFTDNRAPGGTLGNRNFVGHVAAFGLPVVLLVVLQARRPIGVLGGTLGAAVVAGALVLTRSRAAWLAVVLVFGVLVVGGLMAPSLRREGKLLRRCGLLGFVAAAGVVAAILVPNTLNWTSETPYLETARGVVNFQEGSGQGRLIQYRRTLAMAGTHPLLGVGPGNWPVEYPALAARGDPSMSGRRAGMTTNPWPSSDWMALLAERGAVGFFLLALALGGIARSAWRRLRAARGAGEGLPPLALLALLAGVLTAGAFDAVTLLAWPTLLFWAAAGALWTPAEKSPVGLRKWVAVTFLVLVLLAGAGALRSAGQWSAMALYTANESREALVRAARLDPGAYRIHVRAARRYSRDRARRCTHAQAAHALFPHAAEARRLARGCE